MMLAKVQEASKKLRFLSPFLHYDVTQYALALRLI